MTDDAERPADRAPRGSLKGWLVVAGLVVAIAFMYVAVTFEFEAADAPTDEGAALDEAPPLQDLAELGADTPQGNDPAPDFSVPTIGGGAFTLSDHLATDGRPVILNLWASWCFPCRAEMPAIDAFAAANPGVEVVGVAVQDDPVSAEEFAAEIGVAYTLALDEKDSVNEAYRPLGLPATFIIASDGTISKRIFGQVTEASLAAEIASIVPG